MIRRKNAISALCTRLYESKIPTFREKSSRMYGLGVVKYYYRIWRNGIQFISSYNNACFVEFQYVHKLMDQEFVLLFSSNALGVLIQFFFLKTNSVLSEKNSLETILHRVSVTITILCIHAALVRHIHSDGCGFRF